MEDIEVRVNKEINDFRERFYFNLPAKKLISLIITIIVVVPAYLSLLKFSETVATVITTPIGAFILAIGWYEPLGLSFINYLRIINRNKNNFKKPLVKKSDIFDEYYDDFFCEIKEKKKGNKNGQKRKNKN
jgi:hypothetical protein